ncbi:nuclear factor related to kappa-B-binding protein-like isoform X2 [Watersipora subatra]|uniref:nuclear factor related to kappa-B-binding protein-like isoform X2 n=1 Tax=Watersipora subatra TaxID=2589382 RepID=UPI00355AFD40
MTTPSVLSVLEPCVLGGDIIQIPKAALTQEKSFRHVFSDKTWKNVLSEEDRTRLRLLPKGENKEQDTALHKLFTLQNIKFGNPLKRFHKSLKRNHYYPETYYYRQLKRRSLYKAHKQRVLQQHTESLQLLLLLRQNYMEELQGMTEQDIEEKLNPKWREKARATLNLPSSDIDGNAKALYKKTVGGIRRYCRDGYQSSSDDEEDGEGENSHGSGSVDIPSILTAHYKRRLSKQIAPTLDTRGTTIESVMDRVLNDKHDSDEDSESPPPATPLGSIPAKKPKLKPTSQPEKKIKTGKPTKIEEPSAGTSPAVSRNPASLIPYPNVLGLLKAIMTSSSSSLTAEMSESEICEEINRWQETEVAKLCPWASIIHDWRPHIRDILNNLSEHPESPLLVSTAAGFWRWSTDANSSKERLNSEWASLLENIPSLTLIMGDVGGLKTEEDKPESHHGQTFHQQEKIRYAHPHRCFTYKLNGKEYLVGPIKGVYDKVSLNSNNKAREHVLLVNDRPSYVTILTLVRDAAARLPNGEGTRYEICDLLQQSQFISESAPSSHINTVVSGALDRLHYEKDPCVKFDSGKKNWMYLHGDRTAGELEMLHQAQGAALKAKKASKPNKSSSSLSGTVAESEKVSKSTANQASPFLSMRAETQLAEQSIMDVDSVSPLLSAPPAAPSSQSTVSAKPAVAPQMRALKVDHPGELSRSLSVTSPGPTRLISMQLPPSMSQKRPASVGQMNRAASVDSLHHTSPNWPTSETAPALFHSSSLPKGAVVYQRIPSTQGVGAQANMVQKVMTGSSGSSVGKQLSASSSLVNRIVGNTSGTPVLARLVPTQGVQKGAAGGAPQPHLTQLHIPGGDNVSVASRSVQIVSGSGQTPPRTNVLQVQNVGGLNRSSTGGVTMTVGGANRAGVTMNVGGVTRTLGIGKNISSAASSASLVKTTGTPAQSVSQQVRISNLQQQLASGKTPQAVTGNKASLLTNQSDVKGGPVQLVKALITSAEGKPGSQAYILTSNSGQRPFVTTKPSTVSSGNKSGMIARVLQPDGSLTAVKSGRVAMPAGGKSILTNVAGAGLKNPLIVRQVSSQNQLQTLQGHLQTVSGQRATLPGQLHVMQGQRPAAHTMHQGQARLVEVHPSLTLGHTVMKSTGETPRKIEQSELSPSTTVNIETD